MHRRPLFAFLGIVLVTSAAPAASAAPRDAAAKKKIDEAINDYYVVTKFDQAEKHLLGAIDACKNQCSAAIVAKAWMYVGLVRGSGKNNQKSAKDAFVSALVADPSVALDEGLATPQTKKTFQAAQREAGATAAAGPSPQPSEAGEVGPVDCSLKVTEVQTRRPIPVSCTVADNIEKLELKYKVGDAEWAGIKMKRKKAAFEATIPCSATQRPGALRFYVRAEDEYGDPARGFGKKSKPNKLKIVKETEEEPPAFPDKEPPKRCKRSEPDATECESSDDCDTGQRCLEGTCQARKRRPAAFKQNWLGLHFAWDFAIVGGKEVCTLESQRDEGFACFHPDTEQQYRFQPHPKYANDIQNGLAPATLRALVSYEHLFASTFSAGLRLGYAIGGGPPSGKKQEVTFLPYHAEVRVSYWLGEPGASVRGIVGVQGGAAQVDAKLPVTVGDCGGTPGGAPSKPGATLAQDASFYQACTQGNAKPIPLKLDVYKKLGKGFVGVHGGVLVLLSPEGGIRFDVAVMQMAPTSGQVIEPSLGYVLGF